jgi:hypothetical protein
VVNQTCSSLTCGSHSRHYPGMVRPREVILQLTSLIILNLAPATVEDACQLPIIFNVQFFWLDSFVFGTKASYFFDSRIFAQISGRIEMTFPGLPSDFNIDIYENINLFCPWNNKMRCNIKSVTNSYFYGAFQLFH